MIRVGDAVRSARVQRGWSMAELARRVGYSDASMIKQIEQGHKLPSLEKARALALHLGVTLCQLVGDAPILTRESEPALPGASVLTRTELVAAVECAVEGTVQRALLVLREDMKLWVARHEQGVTA